VKEKWLNRLALVVFVLVVGLWVWWLFRPQPMPFVLRARGKVQGVVADGIAFSPKGDWLAALVLNFQRGQSTLTVQLWQVPQTQTNPKVFSVSQQVQPMVISIPRLGFSPDGRLLAVGYREQGLSKVTIFRVADGRRLQTITMGKWVLAPTVTFAPDGRLAVVHDFRLWFVRVDDGKKMPTNIQAKEIAFSPDGRWLAALLIDGSVSLYDANGRLVRQFRQPMQPFWAAAFSKDGQRLACLWRLLRMKLPIAPMRYGVSIWQASDWRLVRSTPLTPFYENLSPSAAFAPDLSMVALSEPDTSGWDGLWWRLEHFVVEKLMRRQHLSASPTQAVVRRLRDGKMVAKLPRFGRSARDFAFSPDGRYLAVLHLADTIALWERKGD